MVLNTSNKLSNLWLKAAALGSLWAANEIIVGSFLHNIRFPLSGTIMSFFSVVFIFAFISRWPQKSLIIRAGIIAAMMKSISPSAIILGPMIGIIVEAVVLELFFRVSKGKLYIMLIGGGLAVSEVLFQKVVTLLLSFGWDIMLMLEALYEYVNKQFMSFGSSGELALIILFSAYFVIGVIAAIVGIKAGKMSFVLEKEIAAIPIFVQKKNESLFGEEQEENYSWPLLFFHLLALIVGMQFIKSTIWYYGLAYVIVYFGLIALRYKRAFNHLKKPSFWIAFFLISLLAGFLFSQKETGDFFSWAGFIIGMKMNIRAALVVISFAAIGKELKSPLIKALLYKNGFQNFYRALNLAFGVLPESLKAFPGPKELFRSPVLLISKLLLYAENLMTELERRDKKMLPVIIISGNIQQGKTTFVRKVINRLKRQNINIGGIMSNVEYEGDKRVGYTLENLKSGDKIQLCNIAENKEWRKQGKFYFNPDAVVQGNKILAFENTNPDLIIIDEIGPLEIKTGGWAPAIQKIAEEAKAPMLWVVRDSLVNKISRKWPVGKIYHFKLSEDLPAADVEKIALKMIEEWRIMEH
jgi:nucleoside-triphosphatase THEP1